MLLLLLLADTFIFLGAWVVSLGDASMAVSLTLLGLVAAHAGVIVACIQRVLQRMKEDV